MSTASEVLKKADFPLDWPFTAANFQRQDESSDSVFYSEPRFCFHIDNFAVSALTKYYDSLPPPSAALDFCSSHVSHYPDSWLRHVRSDSARRMVCMGMNREELEKNEAATEPPVVQDLNVNPTFPFEAESFDMITCTVSVDYLSKPREVFAEIARILRPGGRAVMSFSNRCFPTKAVSLWLQTSDLDHIFIVGCFFHYTRNEKAESLFEAPEGIDISPPSFGLTDPMFVVTACKK